MKIITRSEKKRKTSCDKISYVHVYITQLCNLRCRHCYTYSNKQKGTGLTASEWIIVFKQLSSMNVRTVHIEGGEPLLFPDIEKIVSYISSSKIGHFWLVTNGILASKEYLIKLNGAGLKRVAVSLDSIDENIHNHLRPHSFRHALKAVNTAIKLGFSIRVSCVVTKINIGGIKKFIFDLYDMGVKSINIDWLYDFGRAKNLFDKHVVSKKDDHLLNKFEEDLNTVVNNSRYKDFNLTVNLPDWYIKRNSFLVNDYRRTHYLSCDALKNQIAINQYGDVYPCFIFQEEGNRVGNCKKESLKRIIEILDPKFKIQCPISAKGHIFYAKTAE